MSHLKILGTKFCLHSDLVFRICSLQPQTASPHHLAAPYSSGLAPTDFYQMVITSKMLLTAQVLVAVRNTKAKNINTAKKTTYSKGRQEGTWSRSKCVDKIVT